MSTSGKTTKDFHQLLSSFDILSVVSAEDFKKGHLLNVYYQNGKKQKTSLDTLCTTFASLDILNVHRELLRIMMMKVVKESDMRKKSLSNKNQWNNVEVLLASKIKVPTKSPVLSATSATSLESTPLPSTVESTPLPSTISATPLESRPIPSTASSLTSATPVSLRRDCEKCKKKRAEMAKLICQKNKWKRKVKDVIKEYSFQRTMRQRLKRKEKIEASLRAENRKLKKLIYNQSRQIKRLQDIVYWNPDLKSIKKKQVQSLKAAAQSQEKETTHSKSTSKPAPAPSIDAADKATEQAKKLVQSGAIKVTSQKEKFGFKRSKNFEKKKDTEKPAPPAGFQPFMSFTGEEEEDKQPPSKRMKGLSESFVSAGYGNRSFDRPEREHRIPPKKGNTVFVHGIGITEEMLRKFFSNFGNIVNINMESDKHNAFITFEKMEDADRAIQEANNSMASNVQLRVQMARRQPVFESMGATSSTSSWATIAANTSQKGAVRKEKRGVVTYDADDIF